MILLQISETDDIDETSDAEEDAPMENVMSKCYRIVWWCPIDKRDYCCHYSRERSHFVRGSESYLWNSDKLLC